MQKEKKIITVFYIFLLFCLVLYGFVSCTKVSGRGASVTAFSGAFVERGRPAADLSSYRIAYYEPVEGGYSSGNIQENDDPFVITDWGPRDELPKEIKRPSIYVVFSQPAVPLAKLGEPITESAGLFTIDPPLTGIYRWYGTRLLSFEPDTESLPQMRYTVTVSDRITSLGGKSLQGGSSFSFETERLSVLEWELGDGANWVWKGNVHPEDAKFIRLIFSYPVNLDEIARWIEIRTEGKIWPFTLERLPKIDEKQYLKEQGVLVRINGDLPFDTDVEMELKEGARSESVLYKNLLGTKEAKIWNYHTLLPFRFKNVSVRSYSSPQTMEGDSIPISLEFNQSVDLFNVERYFSVAGFPALKKENINVYGSTVVINRLPLEYQKKYMVQISADLKDLYGRSLGEAVRAEAAVGEANSYVYIQNRGARMLEAGYTPGIVWEAQNPVSLRSRTAAVNNPYEELSQSGSEGREIRLPANTKRFFMEDLSPFLNAAGKGVAALRWDYRTRSSWQRDRIDSGSTWLTVQVTNIGITMRYAYNMVLVWATHLSDGTAVSGADVELMENGMVILGGKTDEQGLVVFEFSGGDFAALFSVPHSYYWDEKNHGKGLRVRVSEGFGDTEDSAEFIPNDSHNMWRFDIEASMDPFTAERERSVIFLFTDRGLYRPGETVTFRGIDRSLQGGHYAAYQGQYQVEASTGGYQAPVIVSLTGETTANGGSYGSFELPADIDPGQYRIIYRRNSAAGRIRGERQPETSISFIVANFERLRFESSLKIPDIPVYRGDKLSASLSASYLSGGGLSGAPFTWYLTREPAGFVPGGKDGSWNNWRFGPELNDGRSYVGRGEGILGPDGKADIGSEIRGDGIDGAVYRYRLEASVQDAARQEISAQVAVLAHPASFYIAARLDQGQLKNAAGSENGFAVPDSSAYFLSTEKPATLSWVLVTPDGSPLNSSAVNTRPGDLSIQLVRHEWKQAQQAGIGGRVNLVWERVEEIVEQRNVKMDPVNGIFSGIFSFTPDKSGLWELRLQNRDQKQRTAATRFRFYVSGAGWVRWGSDDVDTITLTADRSSYKPTDTAKILVRSPLEKGKYLLTLEREGIISQKIIELEGSALTIDIPIEESYVPIVYVALSSYTVRSGPPQNSYYEPDLDKPKGIFGVTPVYVDHESRHYKIEIENSKVAYRPAEEAEVTVKVLLNGKAAAGTEVSFMAVDRGVIDLINYHVPDPAAFFYNPRNFPLGVRGADSRSLLIDPVTYSLSDLQGGDSDDSSKLEERKDFRPTAVFEPFLVTGPDGTVKVKFKLPDSLTTYRCTAIAAGIHDFGISENELKVSAPLTAVAALPRKLRWRDTGTVSLILTNLENIPVEANISLAAGDAGGNENPGQNIIEIDGESLKTVTIYPGMSREVTFLAAAVGTGLARLEFTVRSPQINERIIKTILVDRPVLTETVTTIGSLGPDENFTEEGVVLPSLVPEGTGNVMVSFSASRLAALREAVRYLLEYPYGCIEQRTARLLPLVAFGDHLNAFDLDTPLLNTQNPLPVNKIIENEIADIVKSQLSDGSFPYWPGSRYGDFYVSLRVAHIAALAKTKGIPVPESLNTQRLLAWINSASADTRRNDPFLKGYSLWILAMYGERIGTEISAFLKRGDELGISGWAFAGLAALELGQKDLAASTRDRVRRFIRPGTRSLDLGDTVYRDSGRWSAGFWGGDTDRYALALMLFHSLNTTDEMVTRLANSLIERQRRGVWESTASSYWAVLAFGMLGDSESAEWKVSGDGQPLVSSVSLGGIPLFSAEFRNYGGVPVSYNGSFAEKPIIDLSRDSLLPLRIERTGPGTLYYTAGLRYGIPAELAGARDEGIGVFAETFDSEGEIIKDGRLIPGKTYTRRITVSSSRDRTYLALRSPVPSGAEIIDAVFVTSSTVPPSSADESGYESWERFRPLRFLMDDEARFHWDFFPAGRQQVEYRFRAVMPGIYPTPPASAECMYENEIFGRSAGELIKID